MKLRDYQLDCLNLMNERQEGKYIIKIPTGGGKTVVLTQYIKSNPDKKILVLVHRKFLLKQIGSYLSSEDMKNVCLTTWQSYINKDVAFTPDVVIVDEAHHINNNKVDYERKAEGMQVATKNLPNIQATFVENQKLVFGFTATPYDSLVGFFPLYELSIDRLIMEGHLCDFDVYNQEILNTENKFYYSSWVIERLINKHHRGKSIVYARNIEECDRFAEVCRLLGYRAISWHSKSKQTPYDYPWDILVNVFIATEGFDEPAIDTVFILGETSSAIKYAQMVGRALRPFEGKEKALIVDCGRNSETHGALREYDKHSVLKEVEKKVAVDNLRYSGGEAQEADMGESKEVQQISPDKLESVEFSCTSTGNIILTVNKKYRVFFGFGDPVYIGYNFSRLAKLFRMEVPRATDYDSLKKAIIDNVVNPKVRTPIWQGKFAYFKLSSTGKTHIINVV